MLLLDESLEVVTFQGQKLASVTACKPPMEHPLPIWGSTHTGVSPAKQTAHQQLKPDSCQSQQGTQEEEFTVAAKAQTT